MLFSIANEEINPAGHTKGTNAGCMLYTYGELECAKGKERREGKEGAGESVWLIQPHSSNTKSQLHLNHSKDTLGKLVRCTKYHSDEVR